MDLRIPVTREKTQNTHSRKERGGGSVVQRWGADADTVHVRADRPAPRPGPALFGALAPKSGSLAYVCDRHPRQFLVSALA